MNKVDIGLAKQQSQMELAGRKILIAGPSREQGGTGQFIRYIHKIWNDSPNGSSMTALDLRGVGHIMWSPILLAIASIKILFLRLLGRADLLHLHITVKGSVARKWFLTRLAKTLGIPVVLHVHAADFPQFYSAISPALQKQTRWLFQNVDKCVVLGERFKTYFSENLGVSPEKIEVLYNGVPKKSKVTLSDTPSPFKLLFIGNLIERKGVPELMEALADPRLADLDWHATLAGGGDLERYQADAKERGIDHRLTFAGWVDRDTLNDLIQNADTMVLPSHDEGLPLAILESLAHGIPVLTTPVGSIPEVLTHEETVLLVPAGSVRELADELYRLMTDSTLRQKLSTNGHALIENRLSLEVVAENVADVYAECLAASAK